MASKLKWLIFVHLLLIDQAVTRAAPPQPLANKRQNPKNHIEEEVSINHQLNHLILGPQLPFQSANNRKQDRSQSALRLIAQLKAKLQEQTQYLNIQGKVTCEELVEASTVDDSLSYELPQELLGLSLVPVLVVANCQKDAQILVEKLYNLLGMSDTDQLLLDLERLMERKISKMVASPAKRNKIEQNIDVVMFNIKQLAQDEDTGERCEDWAKLNGTMLIGSTVEGPNSSLEEAVQQCEHMGVLCAGVAHSKNQPGSYQAVLKKGSRILPSDSESWILQCRDLGSRVKRSPRKTCVNRSEQRVYKVMEWIPAVSTLYNLGTAVYYASVNCSETAKERAILSAVDLGTDALMVVTGGTAGVAGYALGAGVKTGVKAGVRYMMNMKEEDDVLVNQFSWEDDSVVFQP
ncbi:uncharacterized protein apof [Periophthalmus magnuspinnatus]|uniref:uncharacterized protein apof n=1 Tax=Periophthalmus magnuspinnatus TaxID=409849 RepID=UPI00145ABAB0|nr:uncharacterized protein apof [Periophthalmus magnuspinnatus]